MHMFYTNMPLYLKLVKLLKFEYCVARNIPKEYKYTLGQDIINRSWELLDLFILAQTSDPREKEKKIATINKMDIGFECLKPRIRFLTELDLISIGQTAVLLESMVEIGKMIGSWTKNA